MRQSVKVIVMGPDALVGMISILSFFGSIFGIVYIRNRENMALIERGINPRIKDTTLQPYVNLKYGLLLVGCGVGLLAAFLLDDYVTNKSNNHDERPAIYFALIAIGGGIGLIISYLIERKAQRQQA